MMGDDAGKSRRERDKMKERREMNYLGKRRKMYQMLIYL